MSVRSIRNVPGAPLFPISYEIPKAVDINFCGLNIEGYMHSTFVVWEESSYYFLCFIFYILDSEEWTEEKRSCMELSVLGAGGVWFAFKDIAGPHGKWLIQHFQVLVHEF